MLTAISQENDSVVIRKIFNEVLSDTTAYHNLRFLCTRIGPRLCGSPQAEEAVMWAKKILDEIGLGGDRLEMFFMSGSQGHSFAIAAQTMTERIRKLGPNPLKDRESLLKINNAEMDEEDTGFRGRHPSEQQDIPE